MTPEQIAGMNQQTQNLLGAEAANITIDWKNEYLKLHRGILSTVKQEAAEVKPPAKTKKPGKAKKSAKK